MALKDQIPFGMSLPHRSPDTIGMTAVHHVAQRAEALGFRDLWVTENTLDHVNSFDPVVALTYAAAVTSRIRLGASVIVLAIHSPVMVAHQWATLDYISGGRAILAVGLGRDPEIFPISKRIFLAVDERPEVARAELNRWFTEVYHNPAGTDVSGVHGTPEQVREQLAELIGMGANHLLLNPVSRHAEQLEAMAEIVGLR